MRVFRGLPLILLVLRTLSFAVDASDIDVAKLQVHHDEKLAGVLQRLGQARSEQASVLSQLNKTLRDTKTQEQMLMKQVGEAKQQLKEEQTELAKQRKSREASDQEPQDLDRETLSKALSDIEARYPWWQKENFGEALRQTQVALSHSNSSPWQKNAQQLKLIAEYAQRLSARFDIQRQPASIAIPKWDGRHAQGQLTVMGPWSIFQSETDDVLGLVSASAHSPTFHSLPGDQEKDLQDWLAGKSDTLPIDLSEGHVFDQNKPENQNWETHLRKGGLWVIPIIGFALLATLISLMKSWQLFRIRQPSQQSLLNITQALEQEKRDEAERHISKLTPLWQSMMRVGLETKASIEWLEESMMEQIMLAQPRLQRGLTIIAVTATTAPLLGLLGTVTGIIKTFKAMEDGGAETQALVQGISEALITTELGLVLAIPALVIHALLSRRAHGLLANMERSCVSVVNVLSRSN